MIEYPRESRQINQRRSILNVKNNIFVGLTLRDAEEKMLGVTVANERNLRLAFAVRLLATHIAPPCQRRGRDIGQDAWIKVCHCVLLTQPSGPAEMIKAAPKVGSKAQNPGKDCSASMNTRPAAINDSPTAERKSPAGRNRRPGCSER